MPACFSLKPSTISSSDTHRSSLSPSHTGYCVSTDFFLPAASRCGGGPIGSKFSSNETSSMTLPSSERLGSSSHTDVLMFGSTV